LWSFGIIRLLKYTIEQSPVQGEECMIFSIFHCYALEITINPPRDNCLP